MLTPSMADIVAQSLPIAKEEATHSTPNEARNYCHAYTVRSC